MNFLEDLLVGHEFKFLSHKVHAHFIHEPCLAHSQMSLNNGKNHEYLAYNLCIGHS
jgi:hypothetical protein